MYRRLYFLFPDAPQTRRTVEELVQAGVTRNRMHAIAREDVDLSDLPSATPQQKRDTAWRLEQLFWGGNLAVFFMALAALLVTWYWGFSLWSLVFIGIMVATFVLGERFATEMPNVHLDEFRGALQHGEVLLMVDVPRWRVAEIEDRVHRRHPEATVGGVGWTIQALGI